MSWYEILSFIGVPVVLSAILVDIYSHIKKRTNETSKLRNQESKDKTVQLIAKVLDDKLKPIKEDIKLIKQQIQYLEKGELSALRADLVQSFNLVVSKGYRTINDTQSWLSMYESYKGLGGNSFIDRLKGDFESLPTEMEYLNNKQQ